MKVSCFVLELTATPAPRAVLNRNRFVPILLKTAYPAAFRISSLDAGWSLYKSSRVEAAILRVLSLFLSGESLALAKPPVTRINAKTEATSLNFINAFLVIGVLNTATLAEGRASCLNVVRCSSHLCRPPRGCSQSELRRQ